MIYDPVLHEIWSEPCASLDRLPLPIMPGREQGIEAQMVISNNKNIKADCIILPDLCAHLIIHEPSAPGQSSRVSLVGARTKVIRIDHHGRSRTTVLRLKPGMVANHGPLSVEDITDRSTDIGELMPAAGELIKDQLARKAPITNTVQELSNIVVAIRPPSLSKTLVGLHSYYTSRMPLMVKNAACHIGISERGLLKACMRDLGMTTHTVLSVVRLKRALNLAQASSSLGWARIAVASGYYDQSHMIADFQKLLGNTPGQLFG